MLENACAGHRRKRRRGEGGGAENIVCFRVISVRVCSQPACTLFFLSLFPFPLNRESWRRNWPRAWYGQAAAVVPESRYASFTEQWTEAGRDKAPANCPPSDLFPLWSFLCSPSSSPRDTLARNGISRVLPRTCFFSPFLPFCLPDFFFRRTLGRFW